MFYFLIEEYKIIQTAGICEKRGIKYVPDIYLLYLCYLESETSLIIQSPITTSTCSGFSVSFNPDMSIFTQEWMIPPCLFVKLYQEKDETNLLILYQTVLSSWVPQYPAKTAVSDQ